ncbi:Centromeric protein E, partial [Reticulomyxa filosa]
MVKCWFESFGCNHKCLKSAINDHLTSNMKLHFDLVIKSFNTLQQTIRQYQEEIRKLSLENETFKVELQLKVKKDEEITHLKQQLDQYQKDNLQLISAQACYIFISIFTKNNNNNNNDQQKTTFIEIEKLKKDIESKDNEIQTIKQEIQSKQKQIIQQMNENKEEQTQNIINTSATLDFQLVSSFKLNNTLTGHTNYVLSIDYSTFDDCQFICSGSHDKVVRVWD